MNLELQKKRAATNETDDTPAERRRLLLLTTSSQHITGARETAMVSAQTAKQRHDG